LLFWLIFFCNCTPRKINSQFQYIPTSTSCTAAPLSFLPLVLCCTRSMLLQRMTVLRWKNYTKMPWVNGNGVTYEMGVRKHDDNNNKNNWSAWSSQTRQQQYEMASGDSDDSGDSESSAAPFFWRMSQANLSHGLSTFSCIPDVDRSLILTEGNDISLTVDKTNTTTLQLHTPFQFAADLPTGCHVGSKDGGRDLNIVSLKYYIYVFFVFFSFYFLSTGTLLSYDIG